MILKVSHIASIVTRFKVEQFLILMRRQCKNKLQIKKLISSEKIVSEITAKDLRIKKIIFDENQK